MESVIEHLEKAELVKKLIDAGYGELVTALLDNNKAFTKRNRLNKSGACRILGWKTKQLEDALAACREILGEDILE